MGSTLSCCRRRDYQHALQYDREELFRIVSHTLVLFGSVTIVGADAGTH